MNPSSKPTLLFILPVLSGGGAERVSLNLLSQLIERDDIEVMLLVFTKSGPLLSQLPKGLNVVSLDTVSLKKSTWSLLKKIRQLNPTLVFSTLGYINLALILMKPFFKSGTTLWLREANLPSISLPGNRYSVLMKAGYKTLYKKTDKLICTSKRMQQEFVRDFSVPENRIVILPNPVDVNTILSKITDVVCHNNDGRHYIAIGRLTHQKGFDRLVEWFKDLEDTSAELNIYGSGPLQQNLSAQLTALGLSNQVHVRGFTDNIYPKLAQADVLVMPSRWEGMPNIALESLVCGTPVIATPESGGIAEIAAQAKEGVVQVVESGAPFIDAMKKVRRKTTMQASFLPKRYHAESVVENFIGMLDEGL